MNLSLHLENNLSSCTQSSPLLIVSSLGPRMRSNCVDALTPRFTPVLGFLIPRLVPVFEDLVPRLDPVFEAPVYVCLDSLDSTFLSPCLVCETTSGLGMEVGVCLA